MMSVSSVLKLHFIVRFVWPAYTKLLSTTSDHNAKLTLIQRSSGSICLMVNKCALAT